MADDDAITIKDLADKVSEAVGFEVGKQSVRHRLEMLGLMDRCHKNSRNVITVPPDVASIVARDLTEHPVKKRATKPKPAEPAAPELIESLQAQIKTLTDALTQANELAQSLQRQTEAMAADARLSEERINELNTKLREAEQQAATYRHIATLMANASLWKRVRGFSEIKKRLPAPEAD